MKFVSVRDLRNRPGQVRDLVRQEDVVLTVNGKPVAVLVAVGEENLEETFVALRRARAQAAVSRIRGRAQETGVSKLSPEDIDAEIQAARASRP